MDFDKGTHVIHFMGDISTASVQNFRNVAWGLAFGDEKASQLYIEFSSFGGAVSEAFVMAQIVMEMPIPVTICNVGDTNSSAIIPYLAAEERLVVPHSKFLVHGLTASLGNVAQTTPEIEEKMDSLRLNVQRYADFFNERTEGAKAPINVLDCLLGNAKVLDAAGAVDAGVANGIIRTADLAAAGGHYVIATTG